MIKNLRFLFTAFLAMIGLSISAQDVTLDFTVIDSSDESGKTSAWGFPASSKNKTVEEQSFSYEGFTVKVAGSTGQGYYWHDKDHYLLFGKQGAYLTLPAFDFDVERIDIEGNGSASAGVKQNIFVGDEAVSTETTGAQGTNYFTIADGKQVAGTIYTIKVTSNHNNQIRSIKIWKKGAGTKQAADLSWSNPSATVTIGADDNIFPTLNNPNNLSVSYTCSKEEVATIDANGVVTLVSAGSAKISAVFEGNDSFEASTVSYNLTVKAAGGDDPTPDPDPDPQPDNVVKATCAEVIAGADDTVFEVTGKCTEIKSITWGNWNLEDETGTIYIYGTLDAEGKTRNFASLGIEVGDIITVRGPKKTYKETTELVDVTVLKIEKGENPDPQPEPTEPTIEGGTTAETAITVANAIAAINTMTDGQTTTASYYVKGFVTAVTEISVAKSNATFTIADVAGGEQTLTVFRVGGLENKSITDENFLKVGDEVVVYAKLQKYIKEETMIPELVKGYVYSVNGKTQAEEKPEEPYTQQGDGTKENPYTVEDLQHMTAEKDLVEGQEMVWMKGVIVGALNSAGSAFAEEVASNIAVAVAAGEADAAKTIPVQLPVGDIRTALNVVDNASNIGKEVCLFGYIQKYMGRSGLKSVADFILDGVQYSASIEGIKADAANSPVYNVAGQRVEKPAKGLYIQKGRKVIVK